MLETCLFLLGASMDIVLVFCMYWVQNIFILYHARITHPLLGWWFLLLCPIPGLLISLILCRIIQRSDQKFSQSIFYFESQTEGKSEEFVWCFVRNSGNCSVYLNCLQPFVIVIELVVRQSLSKEVRQLFKATLWLCKNSTAALNTQKNKTDKVSIDVIWTLCCSPGRTEVLINTW